MNPIRASVVGSSLAEPRRAAGGLGHCTRNVLGDRMEAFWKEATPMMDLSGPGGDFEFNNMPWSHLLRLASMYGWEPAGTVLRGAKDDWDGNYFTNDGQRVKKEDAAHLADALEQA